MMKKKYLIPNTSVVEVETESLMLAQSWTTDGGKTSEGDIIYGGGTIEEDDDQWVPGQTNSSENGTGAKSFNVWE